jgi:hypothetical protein
MDLDRGSGALTEGRDVPGDWTTMNPVARVAGNATS